MPLRQQIVPDVTVRIEKGDSPSLNPDPRWPAQITQERTMGTKYHLTPSRVAFAAAAGGLLALVAHWVGVL